MVTLFMVGLVFLAGMAVVSTVVERALTAQRRLVAVSRKELWLARHGAYADEARYDD